MGATSTFEYSAAALSVGCVNGTGSMDLNAAWNLWCNVSGDNPRLAGWFAAWLDGWLTRTYLHELEAPFCYRRWLVTVHPLSG